MSLTLRLRGTQAVTDVALVDLLDTGLRESAAERGVEWIKAVRHLRVDGETFRDRFTYRGESLWWFAELYLHKVDRITRWIATIGALNRAIDQQAPHGIAMPGGDPALLHIGARVASARGVAWDGPLPPPTPWRVRAMADARAAFLMYSPLAARSKVESIDALGLRRGAVAAFVHTAFWRRRPGDDEGEEGYLGPILDAVERKAGGEGLHLVGVGPRTNFRARRWWSAATETTAPGLPFTAIEQLVARKHLAPSRAVWRDRTRNLAAMRASADLRAHAVVDGCDLWDLVDEDLRGVTWLQFPWSARVFDEALAAIDVLEPSAVVTYAEAGGWGRALMLAARARGVRSIGVQHGFIYRHWLNYRHAADEHAPSPTNAADRGFPRPGATLLFDGYAREHLERHGQFPPASLIVTGSPQLDRTVAGIRALSDDDRTAARAQVGATDEDRIILVAAKYPQMGAAFGALVEATRALDHVRLVVKCHPAETPAPYERDAAGAAHVVVTDAARDLASLLAVSSVVVTVNSTVAIDAMVIGVPAVVVALPNNLSPFVEAGVMVGAGGDAAEIRRALQAVLGGDAAVAARERIRAFADRFVIRADGHAAARAAHAIVGRPTDPLR